MSTYDDIVGRVAELQGRTAKQITDVRDAARQHTLAAVETLAYLLAPVSDAVLDALATVGAGTEDLEPEPTESDGDDEDYTVAV